MLKPLADRVLVRALEAEETTAGGIVLPDTAREKPQEGEVVAVGPGKVLESGKVVPLEVGIGDRVVFSKYGGDEITHDGEEYKILRESDILAVLPARKTAAKGAKKPTRATAKKSAGRAPRKSAAKRAPAKKSAAKRATKASRKRGR
jgi:chaperonin GroES